jgi:hypothetical protein
LVLERQLFKSILVFSQQNSPFPNNKEATNLIKLSNAFSMENTEGDAPSWFLEHCVKTWDELNAQPDPLIVRDTEAHDCQVPREDSSRETYEIESALYDTIRSVVREYSQSPKLGQPQVNETLGVHFSHDALLLRFPRLHLPNNEMYYGLRLPDDALDNTGSRFLACRVANKSARNSN